MRQMRMLKSLLHLFVSHTCHCCDRALIEQESLICYSCLTQIPETFFHLHPSSNEMYYRLAGRVEIATACSMFYFDKKGKLQSLLEALKYKSAPQVGRYMGMLYGKILRDQVWIQEYDALVPIPLHPRKKIQRGYNQAYELSKGLGGELGKPIVSRKVMRTKYTLSQTQKSGGSRWGNVAEAFQAKEGLPASILLVDDVMTTGATMEACIRSIQAAHAEPVRIGILSLALARAH